MTDAEVLPGAAAIGRLRGADARHEAIVAAAARGRPLVVIEAVPRLDIVRDDRFHPHAVAGMRQQRDFRGARRADRRRCPTTRDGTPECEVSTNIRRWPSSRSHITGLLESTAPGSVIAGAVISEARGTAAPRPPARDRAWSKRRSGNGQLDNGQRTSGTRMHKPLPFTSLAGWLGDIRYYGCDQRVRFSYPVRHVSGCHARPSTTSIDTLSTNSKRSSARGTVPTTRPTKSTPKINSAQLTMTRNGAVDFQDRQVYLYVDGEPWGKVKYGRPVTREIPPGHHRVRAFNTLFSHTHRDRRGAGRARAAAVHQRHADGGWLMMMFLHVTALAALERNRSGSDAMTLSRTLATRADPSP